MRSRGATEGRNRYLGAMKRTRLLFLLLALPLALLLGAQTAPVVVSDADLAPLVGSWRGTLTYTDYSDDRKQVSLPTALVITRAKKTGVRLAYTYTEPSGKTIDDLTELAPAKTPGRLAFDGEWEVKAREVSATGLRLEIEGVGKDNNRAATMREIIVVTPDSLTHQKLVRYEGTPDFFQRNRYALARQR